MNGFHLSNNFIEDPEQLVMKTRHHQVPPQRFISDSDPFKEGGLAPLLKEAMAQKTINDFSAPLAANMATGP